MIPPSPPSILVLVLLQGSPVVQPDVTAVCADVQRIELSLAPAASPQEICVSPGLMTGFIFDAPTVVELQDEVRFAEVIRGRSGTGIVPPKDMTPGERLRLTVRIGDGEAQQSITFILVAHRGQATRQVEVYRDPRTRESFLHEVAQEQAKADHLREENRQLRARFERLSGLRGLVATRMLGADGVLARAFDLGLMGYSEGTLSVGSGVSYRSDKTIAVEVWLKNSGSEPWVAAGASLVDAAGEEMKGMKIWQEGALLPNAVGQVVVEVDAENKMAQGELQLRLSDGVRTITLPKVKFP